MQNYDDMSIIELWSAADRTKNGKTLREIHRALKNKGIAAFPFRTHF